MPPIILSLLKYLGPALLVAVPLGVKIIHLESSLAKTNSSLNAEIQCRQGSTCAQRIQQEAQAGAAATAAALSKAKTENDIALAALQAHAANAVRQVEAAKAAGRVADILWQKRLDAQIGSSAVCANWTKVRVPCEVP